MYDFIWRSIKLVKKMLHDVIKGVSVCLYSKVIHFLFYLVFNSARVGNSCLFILSYTDTLSSLETEIIGNTVSCLIHQRQVKTFSL